MFICYISLLIELLYLVVRGGTRWTVIWRNRKTIANQHDSRLHVPLEFSACIEGVFWNARGYFCVFFFPLLVVSYTTEFNIHCRTPVPTRTQQLETVLFYNLISQQRKWLLWNSVIFSEHWISTRVFSDLSSETCARSRTYSGVVVRLRCGREGDVL
jgi:hypothetical protein